MAENTRDQSPNPPFAQPPKPMTVEELLAWHKQNGTLRQFLADYDCGLER